MRGNVYNVFAVIVYTDTDRIYNPTQIFIDILVA